MGGLASITANQLTEIRTLACEATGEAQPSKMDAGDMGCRLAYPQVTYVPCGGSLQPQNVEIGSISVVNTRGDGTILLVGYTSPDCTGGDGYYVDLVTNELVLCPNTCSAIRADSKGLIQAYSSQCPFSPPCD